MAECAVCSLLKKTCKNLGDEGFCDNLIKDLMLSKITEEEMMNKIGNKFGPENFKKGWEKNLNA